MTVLSKSWVVSHGWQFYVRLSCVAAQKTKSSHSNQADATMGHCITKFCYKHTPHMQRWGCTVSSVLSLGIWKREDAPPKTIGGKINDTVWQVDSTHYFGWNVLCKCELVQLISFTTRPRRTIVLVREPKTSSKRWNGMKWGALYMGRGTVLVLCLQCTLLIHQYDRWMNQHSSRDCTSDALSNHRAFEQQRCCMNSCHGWVWYQK